MTDRVLTYLRRQHAGLLALFIALSGTSYAVATGSIDSREIKNNTVRSQDIRTGGVRGAEIRNGAVRSRDVRNNALLGADIADGTLGGEDVRNSSLGDADLGANSVSGDELRSNSVQTDEVQNGSLRSEDFAPGVLASNAVVRFDSFSVAGGGTASDDVACASGERALGGGVSFATDDPDDRVVFSEPRAGGAQPTTQGATATGWRAGIANGDAAERTANVWAICASR
jgi:hypothetical protein